MLCKLSPPPRGRCQAEGPTLRQTHVHGATFSDSIKTSGYLVARSFLICKLPPPPMPTAMQGAPDPRRGIR